MSTWHSFAVQEIQRSTRKMTAWETDFFKTIKKRIDDGFALSDRQEASLLKLHQRMMDIGRINK